MKFIYNYISMDRGWSDKVINEKWKKRGLWAESWGTLLTIDGFKGWIYTREYIFAVEQSERLQIKG